MWTVISTITIILFSIVGLTFLIEHCWLYIIRPNKDPARTIVIYLKSGIAEAQIKAALEEQNWLGLKRINNIAAIDCGLDKEEAFLCKRLLKKGKNIYIDDKEIINLLKPEN